MRSARQSSPSDAPSRIPGAGNDGPASHGLARHTLVFVPLAGAIASPGYLKVTRRQVNDAPSTGTGGALPTGDEEATIKHCDLACQHGGGGERRFARR